MGTLPAKSPDSQQAELCLSFSGEFHREIALLKGQLACFGLLSTTKGQQRRGVTLASGTKAL